MSGGGSKSIGESRETWCAVERMKEESWCRAQRKHYDCHLQSATNTGQEAELPSVARCTWKPENPKLKERKHYDHTFNSQLPM